MAQYGGDPATGCPAQARTASAVSPSAGPATTSIASQGTRSIIPRSGSESLTYSPRSGWGGHPQPCPFPTKKNAHRLSHASLGRNTMPAVHTHPFHVISLSQVQPNRHGGQEEGQIGRTSRTQNSTGVLTSKKAQHIKMAERPLPKGPNSRKQAGGQRLGRGPTTWGERDKKPSPPIS